MLERDFDKLLEQEMDLLPPTDSVMDDVNPWRPAMNMVLWGVGLTTLTLNWGIIPLLQSSIGMILMVLGFRALRRENSWFKTAYAVSILRMLQLLCTTFIRTTIYADDYLPVDWESALSFLNIGLIYITVCCLWGGFRAVQRKAGLKPHAGSAAWMLVWMTVILLLGIAQVESILLWGLIAAYFCIIRGLYKLSLELDEAGYAIEAAPVRASNLTAGIVYTLVLLGGMGIGYTQFSQFPMEWTPVQARVQPETTDICTKLQSLGVPEQVVKDLTEEELTACAGAEFAYVMQQDFSEEEDILYADGQISAKHIRITSVALRIPGDTVRWKIIHHFQWIRQPNWSGTEAIQLKPVYTKDKKNEGYREAGDITGRLLCELDGITHTASYVQLEWLGYTANSFFGSSFCFDFFASFSLPREGENQRGYLLYDVTAVDEGWLLYSYCFYFHQTDLMFPNTTAINHAMYGSWLSDDPFRSIYNEFVFRPTEEVPELLINGE